MARPAQPDKDLESLNKKLQLLRDDVAGVALGYHPGMIVYGAGGIGKSFTIRKELARLRVRFTESTAQLTARGLFDLLGAHPGDVTVVEDGETLLRSLQAVSVLRAALWPAPPVHGRRPGRRVTWKSDRGEEEFDFTGGLILVGNSPPPSTPEVRALLTRVLVTHLRISTAELTAHIRHLARTSPPMIMGYRLRRPEAREVAEYVIGRSSALERPLDLRILYHAYAAYVQDEQGESGARWPDRVAAFLEDGVVQFAHGVDVSGASGKERLDRQRAIAAEIIAETGDRREQLKLWRARTELGVRTFGTRKRELKTTGGRDEARGLFTPLDRAPRRRGLRRTRRGPPGRRAPPNARPMGGSGGLTAPSGPQRRAGLRRG